MSCCRPLMGAWNPSGWTLAAPMVARHGWNTGCCLPSQQCLSHATASLLLKTNPTETHVILCLKALSSAQQLQVGAMMEDAMGQCAFVLSESMNFPKSMECYKYVTLHTFHMVFLLQLQEDVKASVSLWKLGCLVFVSNGQGSPASLVKCMPCECRTTVPG